MTRMIGMKIGAMGSRGVSIKLDGSGDLEAAGVKAER